jgi:putative effector of murein hydrolase LrgA (UPF0299 family)
MTSEWWRCLGLCLVIYMMGLVFIPVTADVVQEFNGSTHDQNEILLAIWLGITATKALKL